MNEELTGVAKRLIALRAKLRARDGRNEYRESNDAIRAEIARLETVTLKPVAS